MEMAYNVCKGVGNDGRGGALGDSLPGLLRGSGLLPSPENADGLQLDDKGGVVDLKWPNCYCRPFHLKELRAVQSIKSLKLLYPRIFPPSPSR